VPTFTLAGIVVIKAIIWKPGFTQPQVVQTGGKRGYFVSLEGLWLTISCSLTPVGQCKNRFQQ